MFKLKNIVHVQYNKWTHKNGRVVKWKHKLYNWHCYSLVLVC